MALTTQLQPILRELAIQQGKRTTTKLASASTSAAAAITLLVHMRNFAAVQDTLSRRDIQAAIDGFLEGAELEETENDMGAIVYQRRAKATTKPTTAKVK